MTRSDSPLSSRRRAHARSCPTCGVGVIASTDTCPWCESELTPTHVVEHTMDAALEATTLLHLTTRLEPGR